MANRLSGRVAVVTGAASGIGAAIARHFVSEEAKVVIADVQTDAAEALADELGSRASFLELDVRNEDHWRAALARVAKDHDALDILVNNAGVTHPSAPVQETARDQFDQLIQVNLLGTYLGCRLAYPMLRKTQGCVLNISSMAGVTGQARHAVYAATKGAIKCPDQVNGCRLGARPGSDQRPLSRGRQDNSSGTMGRATTQCIRD